MLSAKRRLSAAEVRKVRKTAKQSRLDGFLVYFMPESDVHKHAVVVSKKHGGGAVDRNRARRQAYGVIESTELPDGRYVWVATSPVTEKTLTSISRFADKRVQ